MSRRKPSTQPWNIKQINTMIQKGTMSFNHPLQRPAGQWKIEDKSLLIDSLLTLYCPDVFALKVKGENGNTYDIIDGKQRLTTIAEFLADQFELTELQPFCLEATGNEEYNISGKKFSDLPEAVQNEITGYSLGVKVFDIDEGDDEESIIEEIFYRLNNGKPMSNEHKALVRASHNVQKFCHRMATEHPLFIDNMSKFSETAVKKSDIEMTILQSIVLASGKEYTSFAAKDIEKFFIENDITDDILELTEKSFSDIVEAFNEYNKFLSKVNISILAYVFAQTQDKVKTIENLLAYVATSKPHDDYRKYTGSGNVKKDSVQNRIRVMSKLCGVEEVQQVAPEQEDGQEVAK